MFQIPDFELIRPIPYGALGTAWLGRNIHDQQLYCLKIAKVAELVDTSAELAKIRKYKQHCEDHSCLVQIGRVGRTDDLLYFVVRLADNADTSGTDSNDQNYQPLTLERFLDQHGRLTADESIEMISPILKGLTVLHREFGAHGWVNPSNIMRAKRQWKLGVPALLTSNTTSNDATADAAKETDDSFRPTENRTDAGGDLYAVGKTLLLMSTGKKPASFTAFQAGELRWPNELKESGLHRVIRKACRTEENGRFESAQQFQDALRTKAGTNTARSRAGRREPTGNLLKWCGLALIPLMLIAGIVVSRNKANSRLADQAEISNAKTTTRDEAAGAVAKPQDVKPIHLRYDFKNGQKLAYDFEISAQLGQPQTIKGRVNYSVGSIQQASARSTKSATSAGTGFVITSDGYLVTAAHVIENAKSISVKLNNDTYEGRIIATDFNQDIALLKIDATNLPSLRLANSDNVELAQAIRVVGYPLSDVLGTGLKITSGIIAGMLDQNGKRFQVDAAVNPGNSGGPVVDATANVVGVATAKLSGLEVSKVGFVVPANIVRRFAKSNDVEISTDTESSELSGPELARRVQPAVAYLNVKTTTPESQVARINFTAAFQSKSARYLRRSDRGHVLVTEHGSIRGIKATENLPFVFDPIAAMFVERLDRHGRHEWNIQGQSTLTVTDDDRQSDPFGIFSSGNRRLVPRSPRGRRFNAPRRTITRKIPAVENVTYKIESADDQTVSVNKKYVFRTAESAKRPFMAINGESQIEFDRKLGVPRELNYEGNIIRHSENTRTEIPVRFSYSLVSDEQLKADRERREKIAAEFAAESVRPLTEQEIAKLIEDLGSFDRARVSSAVHSLSRKKSQQTDSRVADAIMDLMQSDQTGLTSSLASALQNWSTVQQAPRMAELIDHDSVFVRMRVIQTLGKWKYEPAIERIGKRFAYQSDRREAGQALRLFGVAAEPALIDVVNNSRDFFTLKEACEILQQFGSVESVPALETLRSDAKLQRFAERAISAIRQREAGN